MKTSSADKKLSVKDLSEDQREVYDKMRAWIDRKWFPDSDSTGMLLRMGGYGGTGKSSLLGVLSAALQEEKRLVAYVTFTGKASSVLQRKLKVSGVTASNRMKPAGNWAGGSQRSKRSDEFFLRPGEENMAFCGTIHRFVYQAIIDETTDEVVGYRDRKEIDRPYSLICIDEASMVGDKLLEELKRFNVPILAVGDHGQLPPVMDTGSLMEDPDLRLVKIHRQARGNPIIELSRTMRRTGAFDRGLADDDLIRFLPKSQADAVIEEAFAAARSPLDVGMLCWMNRTRVLLNTRSRRALGREGPPRESEPVICLKNYAPVYNGMRGLLTMNAEPIGRGQTLSASVEFPEEGLPAQDFTLCGFQFNREKTFGDLLDLQQVMPNAKRMGDAGSLFDFGYAMTVHRSQGSSFKHVILFMDRPQSSNDKEYRRWCYTAITRSSRKLTVLV